MKPPGHNILTLQFTASFRQLHWCALCDSWRAHLSSMSLCLGSVEAKERNVHLSVSHADVTSAR